VPGVVLLDQAMLLAMQMHGPSHASGWQVAQAKFFVPVGPSQVLHFALQATPRGAIAFRVSCDGREVAAGSLVPPAP
jgi:3-hydroxyacyl-[acyl-carrier-protein] dehydratase